jgi:hypothetical protein
VEEVILPGTQQLQTLVVAAVPVTDQSAAEAVRASSSLPIQLEDNVF